MKKVLLSEKISDKGVKILTDAGFDVEISPSTEEAVMCEQIADAYAVIMRATDCNRAIISAGKELKIIARHGTGIDNIDVPAATEQGVVVAKVDGANAYSVAEYVIAAMLTLSRRLLKSNDAFRSREICVEGASLPGLAVRFDLNGYEIYGKRLGIIGLGRIGNIIVKLAQAMGVEVWAYDPYAPKDRTDVTIVEEVSELYPVCDFITVNVPLTDETRNMIAKDQLAMMKQTAIVINAGRGGIVNEEDLAEALNHDVIGGAALDVFLPEPPTKDNPLLDAKNVLLTAHIAGTTFEAGEALAIGAAQAIVDFSQGKKPQFTVNYDAVVKA